MQHEVHGEVSLELRRRVAARLCEQPTLLQIARDNLARWLRQNVDAPARGPCYREWLVILKRLLDELQVQTPTPARRQVRLEAMTMNKFGVTGPLSVAEVEVNE